jgi:hypothetical protein
VHYQHCNPHYYFLWFFNFEFNALLILLEYCKLNARNTKSSDPFKEKYYYKLNFDKKEIIINEIANFKIHFKLTETGIKLTIQSFENIRI